MDPTEHAQIADAAAPGANALVVCVGGGGAPVVADDAGRLSGVEAVIDKDLSAALLAVALGADALLLLLTDAPGVERDWGTDHATLLREIRIGQLRGLRLAGGSMGPKAEAAARFARAGGGRAVIGALADAAAMIAGQAGTTVRDGSGGQPPAPSASMPLSSA